MPTKVRYIGWKGTYKCKGEYRHNICLFSMEDIPELVTRKEFFANKFQLEKNPIAYQCMEDWINKKVENKETVKIIDYCRQSFVIPYANKARCAGLS